MTDRGEKLLDDYLILKCQEGSSEAFDGLVRRWQPRLWRHALRLTGREDAAWDVVQESWIAITRGLASLRDAGAFRRWAYTIVSRKAATWQRRRRREERDIACDPESLEASRPSVDPAVLRLRDALLRLSPDRRTLLALHYLEEFELWEIAEILGVPEGTVKSRLYHARKELKAICERME